MIERATELTPAALATAKKATSVNIPRQFTKRPKIWLK